MLRYIVLMVWCPFGVQKTLEHTQDNLHETTENLKQANIAIKERDFVIANQREAGEHPGADEVPLHGLQIGCRQWTWK